MTTSLPRPLLSVLSMWRTVAIPRPSTPLTGGIDPAPLGRRSGRFSPSSPQRICRWRMGRRRVAAPIGSRRWARRNNDDNKVEGAKKGADAS
uniref:Uncharacterized protein n=1 Tax=Oryza meridionalis TaxID=40149 RepID=A0A0E0CPU1_9ORYZ